MDYTPTDFFFHVRVFVGIVTGLAVARLARFVQHLERLKSYHVLFVTAALIAQEVLTGP